MAVTLYVGAGGDPLNQCTRLGNKHVVLARSSAYWHRHNALVRLLSVAVVTRNPMSVEAHEPGAGEVVCWSYNDEYRTGHLTSVGQCAAVH